MKRSVLFLTALFLSLTSANAQFWKNETVKGNGDMSSENRSTKTYDNIYLVGSMDVELVAGPEGNIKIEAESNLLEYIVTEVENGTLKIKPEERTNLQPSRNNSIKITVPFEDLAEVKVTGSGDLWNSDVIKEDSFETTLTGSGNIDLHLDVNSLNGQITGSGDISLKGQTSDFDCKVTGSGDFKAFDLEASEVSATVMGSGDIMINAVYSLDAKVMGSGDITYTGNPDRQDFKAMGSGKISSK